MGTTASASAQRAEGLPAKAKTAFAEKGGDAQQRQYIFINEGLLQESPTVRHLLRFLEPVRAAEFCENILTRFLEDDALYALPVIDAKDKPIGLVDRKKYIEFFSKRYTREIFGRRNILELFAHRDYEHFDPIVVDEECVVKQGRFFIRCSRRIG